MDEPTNVAVYRGEDRVAYYKDIADSEVGTAGVLLGPDEGRKHYRLVPVLLQRV